MTSWKKFTLLNGETTFNVCFGEKVKRLDIRKIINDKPSKYGVSLTGAEFRYIYKYYKNFSDSPLQVQYFNIKLRKYSNTSIEIMKNDSKVITHLSFWDKIAPFVPLAVYLVTKEIAVSQFIDLYILSFFMEAEEMLTRKWSPSLCLLSDPDNSIVFQLGLAEAQEFKNRKIDTESLDLFIGSNKEVFSSLVAFMYK